MFRRILATLTVGLFISGPVGAYQFTPIHAQLTPMGPGSSVSFTATNPHATPVALELEIVQRSLDAHGKEHRAPEPDNFLIVPPQLILMPNQSQTVRVQWLGDPDLAHEAAFRLLATQVPVNLDKDSEGAMIEVNYNYEISLYVTPPGARPDVQVEALAVQESETGRQLQVTLRNHGRQRGILEQPELELQRGDGASLLLAGEQVAPLAGQNIFPGGTRLVNLPWPEELKTPPVAANLRTRYLGLSD
jgi:fimbrial chaperone protein